MPVDMVNSPPHYTQGKYETIEVIEDAKWGYRLATAFKYIHRCEYKGKKKEDLRKAIWFILREINSIEDEPTNAGKDLGYNAWTCKRCRKGTNLVDSAWVCANCRSLELEVESESLSKPPADGGKVILPIVAKDRLGARTEAPGNRKCTYSDEPCIERMTNGRSSCYAYCKRGYHTKQTDRSIMLDKHYPDNEVHKEQLTLWNMVDYD